MLTDSPEKTTKEVKARYYQALRLGYMEMERIIEEIIIPEFYRLNDILVAEDYTVEVIITQTQSALETEHGRPYACGAGLQVNRGYMKNAIVYTGDPYRFEFDLQTHNYASRTTEESVPYHKLTPKWFHQRVHEFAGTAFRGIDFSPILNSYNDDWEMFQPPFSLKMKNQHGYFNEIATAPNMESAFQISSYTTKKHHLFDDQIIIVDCNGREIT